MNVQHTGESPIYFDHYAPEALREILDTQDKITEFTQKKIQTTVSDTDN